MSTGPRVVGRYLVYDEIAVGGMASVHIGRLQGPVGFSRTVAIKRLHAQYAKDPEFVGMFVDEARLAARIQHPNVVATVDVIALGGELFLVMDYVQGETLARVVRAVHERGGRLPPPIALGIVADALYGLHAAHEATSERGEPLAIVHRDVSPQNIIVGKDGIARVLDFGVAKAALRIQTTRDGQLKGKLGYMAPEQLTRKPVDRRTDVFAASVVLWEALTGTRLFAADHEGGTIARILIEPIPPPSSLVPNLAPVLDAIVLRGLARDPEQRFATAHEMATALEGALPIARPADVAAYIEEVAGPALTDRARRVAEMELTVRAPPRGSSRRCPAERGIEHDGARDLQGSAHGDSGTSVASTSPDGARRRRRVLAVALLALVAIAGIPALAWRLLDAPRRVAAAAPSAEVDAAPPSASLAASAPPSASLAASAASIAPSTPLARTTERAPVDAASSARPRVERARVRPPSTLRQVPKACTPPFYFDGNGVKRFKPECI